METLSCQPNTNPACSELKILASSVKINTGNLTELKHAILGNAKVGMKADVTRIDSAVNSLNTKINEILVEQTKASNELAVRRLRDEMNVEKSKSWKVVLMSVFEKMVSPIIVAVVLYGLLK